MRRFLSCLVLLPVGLGCSAGKTTEAKVGGDGGTDSSAAFDVGGLDASLDGDPGTTIIPDPDNCQQAAAGHTYVGCDFWPTVTDNMVRPDFDFAVVVANTGAADVTVDVSRGATHVTTVTVPANGLTPIYLPWVAELKAVMPNNGCGTNVKTTTVRAVGGAYHLVSTAPVAVYQFNAIEYAGKGGPAGKSWATCSTNNCFGTLKCFSYTNDASLLLPTSALTGTYRVAGTDSWNDGDPGSTDPSFTFPPYFAVTGTQDRTTVTVKLSATGSIVGGGGVATTGPGGTVTFTLGAGDVVEVVGAQTKGSDFSGSLVTASAPVQVISGIACTNMPHDTKACDHLEQSQMPAETLGKHYFVTRPTSTTGTGPGNAIFKLYGNVDGTKLTYPGGAPAGAPSTIGAGEVVDLGQVDSDFEIVGDHELTVGLFMLGGGPITALGMGDPSMSFAVAVEQYRLKYVFLAPADYDLSFADVVQPMDAKLTLDGVAVTTVPKPISSGFGVARVKLGPGKNGAHVLTASAPVGIQVMGYGSYTSYQYPGGLNLGHIAPAPIR